jgi:hypothetical protein
MADAKISELTAIDAVAAADLLAIVDDPAGTPVTKKATASQIKDYIVALANTWTATQTITPAANTNALASTGYSLTGSNAQSLIDLAGTWNTSGTPTAIKHNVTDTASNASSLLMDLQLGGTSLFKVAKTGAATFRVSGVDVGFLTSGLDVGTYGILRVGTVNFGPSNDVSIRRKGAANICLGNADAAAPVAQTLSVQSVGAGTSNTAGANLTITGSQGTGTGAGGSIIFQVAPAGSSGTAQNALVRALAVTSGKSVVVGDNTAALATNATDGFLYVPTCAGTPTGTPTAQTGTVPIVVDTTNNKLYFYSGAAWRDAGP